MVVWAVLKPRPSTTTLLRLYRILVGARSVFVMYCCWGLTMDLFLYYLTQIWLSCCCVANGFKCIERRPGCIDVRAINFNSTANVYDPNSKDPTQLCHGAYCVEPARCESLFADNGAACVAANASVKAHVEACKAVSNAVSNAVHYVVHYVVH